MSSNRLEMLELMESLRSRGEEFCMVTVVRTEDATSAKAGAKAIVTRDGALHGFIGGGCVQGATRRVALEALAADEPRLIRVRPKQDVVTPVDVDGVELHKSGCPSGGTVDLFLEPVRRQLHLVVCGTSPVAAALMRLARGMGHRVTIAARAETPPGGDGEEHHAGFDLAALELAATDAVVVATQGERDREALAGALRSPCGYVGMVGSRRKIGAMLDQLAGEIPAQRRSELRGPAGLDIGAIEPEEIALSILGELVELRRRGIRHATPGTGNPEHEEDTAWNSNNSW